MNSKFFIFSFFVFLLLRIHQKNKDYTLTLYLHQYWRDERLKFGQDDNIELTLSGDFSERIWVPDTL